MTIEEKAKAYDTIINGGWIRYDSVEMNIDEIPENILIDIYMNKIRNQYYNYMPERLHVLILKKISITDEIIERLKGIFNYNKSSLPESIARVIINSPQFTKEVYYKYPDVFKDFMHIIKRRKSWGKDVEIALENKLQNIPESVPERIRANKMQKLTNLNRSTKYIIENSDCFDWSTIIDRNIDISAEILNSGVFEKYIWEKQWYMTNEILMSLILKLNPKTMLACAKGNTNLVQSSSGYWKANKTPEIVFELTSGDTLYSSGKFDTIKKSEQTHYSSREFYSCTVNQHNNCFSDWAGIYFLLNENVQKDPNLRKQILDIAKENGIEIPDKLYQYSSLKLFGKCINGWNTSEAYNLFDRIRNKDNMLILSSGEVYEMTF